MKGIIAINKLMFGRVGGSVVSQYDYTNDEIGRRTEIARSGTKMTETRSDTYGSEVVHFSRANGVAAHYEYAPFGEVTAQVRQGGITAYDFATLNPWRFSSEYADDASATVYYNYRHYEPVMGRWMSRDPIISLIVQPYFYCSNYSYTTDVLGLLVESANNNRPSAEYSLGESGFETGFLLNVKAENIREGCELNFIQLNRGFENGKPLVWQVDNKSKSDVPLPLGAFYYNYSDSEQSQYLKPDGTAVFLDRPTDAVECYLVIVQRCCLEYYGGSKRCECCKKSQATVLNIVHWKSINDDKVNAGKAEIMDMTSRDRKVVKYLLKKLVKDQEFMVSGCVEYVKDNNIKNDAMPTTVEVDFGGIL